MYDNLQKLEQLFRQIHAFGDHGNKSQLLPLVELVIDIEKRLRKLEPDNTCAFCDQPATFTHVKDAGENRRVWRTCDNHQDHDPPSNEPVDLSRLYPKYNCPKCGDWFHLPYKQCKCHPAAEVE